MRGIIRHPPTSGRQFRLFAFLVGLAIAPLNPDSDYVLPSDARMLTACPNDCSFHGICIETECECDMGWAGEDCSYRPTAFVSFGIRSLYPTSGTSLGGTRIVLTGFNIANHSTLACRFAPHGNGTVVIAPAEFINSSAISCLAPPSALASRWNATRLAEDEASRNALTPASPLPPMPQVTKLQQDLEDEHAEIINAVTSSAGTIPRPKDNDEVPTSSIQRVKGESSTLHTNSVQGALLGRVHR